MWCEKCEPGTFATNGRCYTATEGEPCTTDAVMSHCAECRKFSNEHVTSTMHCMKCEDGYYQHMPGHGECMPPAETHCTKDASSGPWELDGKCVDVCPEGFVANPMHGKCECPKYSHLKHSDGVSMCECPGTSSWHATEMKCVCTGTNEVLTYMGCAEDRS